MEIILIICLLLGILGLKIPLICIEDKISKVNDNLKEMNEYLERICTVMEQEDQKNDNSNYMCHPVFLIWTI